MIIAKDGGRLQLDPRARLRPTPGGSRQAVGGAASRTISSSNTSRLRAGDELLPFSARSASSSQR